MIVVLLLLVIILLGIALPIGYRQLVYLCYCAFPKDKHFLALKTYQQHYHKYFPTFLFIIYLAIMVCVEVMPVELVVNIVKNAPLSLSDITPYQLFVLVIYSWKIIFAALLVLISSLDFKLHLIPLRLLLGLFIWVIFYQMLVVFIPMVDPLAQISLMASNQESVEHILYGQWWLWKGFFSLLLWLGFYIIRQGVGIADIYFLWVLLFLFDINRWLWVILIACLLGLIYALFIKRQKVFPFGPWIALSSWLFFSLS